MRDLSDALPGTADALVKYNQEAAELAAELRKRAAGSTFSSAESIIVEEIEAEEILI